MGVHCAVIDGPGDDRVSIFVSIIYFSFSLPDEVVVCSPTSPRRLVLTHAVSNRRRGRKRRRIHKSTKSICTLHSTRSAVRLRSISCLLSIICNIPRLYRLLLSLWVWFPHPVPSPSTSSLASLPPIPIPFRPSTIIHHSCRPSPRLHLFHHPGLKPFDFYFAVLSTLFASFILPPPPRPTYRPTYLYSSPYSLSLS